MSKNKNVLKLSSPETRQYWEVPVIFEDASFLAINKPAGILTTPDLEMPENPSLVELIHSHIERGIAWAKERELGWIRQVHSADVDTSGVLLFGKSQEAVTSVQDQINSRTPIVTYSVFVQYAPAEDELTVDAKIAKHPVTPNLYCISASKGKQSLTNVRVTERFTACSLLECQPMPDRAHQLRLHLKHVGSPVIGDDIYGGEPLMLSSLKKDYRLKKNKSENPLIGRAAIHASRMCFKHPVSGEIVEIECELPKDFQVSLKYLRKFAISSTADPGSQL